MEKNYDPKIQEKNMYALWGQNDVFSPEGCSKLRESNGKSFSILMPPPNANAALHCGHATYSIQDLMIRFKRMQGFDTVYFPGTDHAGFETQVVYERLLKKQGKSRFDFDRKTFYNDVFNFVVENSNVAINQLKALGMSADWKRNTFMLDDFVIKTVYETFNKMSKDGLVYRDLYMVNYSTFHGTTFSDLETEYIDAVSPLYYVKYYFADNKSEFITVATVRPETIYADVAIAVNPNDETKKKFVGKKVLNPLTNKEIPVIEDLYVDMEFGTGALKITPGHDVNDFNIGRKHNLEIISVINLDGKMNSNAPDVEGMYPKPARIKVAEILSSKGNLEKIDENYKNRILVDYKDNNPIEPLVIPNWFVDMNKLSDLAIKAVEQEDVKFNKKIWKKEILHWLTAKKPWPISRQTVFGIRIPVWYSINNSEISVTFLDKNNEVVSGKIKDLLANYSISEIKANLQKVIAPIGCEFIVQAEDPGDTYLPETDTFDTWFSSGQWPLTTTKYPSSSDFKKYFPTSFLDSMWDIMFFWIARMIMLSLYLTNEVPFKNVYFHGAITDKFGKKMSKSRGNVVNPMEWVEKYGADALRMGILVGGNTASRMSPLDEDKVRGYRNFANKLWNITRYLEFKNALNIDYTNLIDFKEEDMEILKKLNNLIQNTTEKLEKYRFKTAGEEIYSFLWDTLASDYLEKTKGREDTTHLSVIKLCLINSLKLLHPFMPFVTESLWQEIPKNESEVKILAAAKWPEPVIYH